MIHALAFFFGFLFWKHVLNFVSFFLLEKSFHLYLDFYCSFLFSIYILDLYWGVYFSFLFMLYFLLVLIKVFVYIWISISDFLFLFLF
jgi:hypothetical protein